MSFPWLRASRGVGSRPRVAVSLDVLLACVIACASSNAIAAEKSSARLTQGQFDSAADADAFQVALAKAFGDEVTLSHASGDGEVGDTFGYAVALAGDTALVGAPSDDTAAGDDAGSAYVFTRGGTTWTQQAKLTAGDAAANALLGWSVALSGDTALVGAFRDDTTAGVNAGSAYVFTRSGTTWTQQAKLTAGDAAAFDEFGWSVALSGDTALVGTPIDNTASAIDAGSAYVFVRSGTSWTQQARITADDGTDSDQFGYAVALSGDTALIGARFDDTPAGLDTGSAYVFTRSGTTWTQQANLTAEDGADGDLLGGSVALSGDTALVGAIDHDTAAGSAVGSAYVFARSGTAWSQQAKLMADDGAAGDQFGWSVALAGDTALVGADGDNLSASSDAGSAYVFTRSGTAWTQQAKLTAGDSATADQFGVSVALSGDSALVGAFNDDTPAGGDAGSAAVFVGSGASWTHQARLSAGDRGAGDQFGISVALSGDTALIGACLDDAAGMLDAGAAFVFTRSGSTWSLQAALAASDGEPSDRFGCAVAVSGDTALVGAYADNTAAGGDAGSAYVFTRSGTTWTEQARLDAGDGATNDYFGYSVALLGDTALVGAYLDDSAAGSDAGSAYVFTRSGTTWTEQAKLTAGDGAANDWFGRPVVLSGDSALVGASQDDTAAVSNAGSAYVFTRIDTTWTQEAKLTAGDGATNDQFGASVALSGDTALVGAFADDTAIAANAGSAYVFTRSDTTWTQQAKLTAGDAAANDWFGWSVALSGDTALVGARLDDTAADDAGSVYVLTRGGTTWTQQAKLTSGNGAANDEFGHSVALSPSHALIGVPLDDNEAGDGDVGSARIFTLSTPTLRIDDEARLEGDSGSADLVFTVTRSHNITGLSFRVDTADGTATAGEDYTGIVGQTITLPAFGPNTVTIAVPVHGNLLVERNESFTVTLSDAQGAVLEDGAAVGTIQNDDAIMIIPVALLSGAVGVDYAQSFTADRGVPPYSYAVTGGSLPSGVALSSAGALSGTPTTAGSFPLEITATDSTPAAEGGPFTAVVQRPLSIAQRATTTTIASTQGAATVNDSVTYTATITGFAPGGSVRFFDTAAGTLSDCATVPVDGAGTATCVSTRTRVGARSIQADYLGDTNNTASTSSTLAISVAAPTLVIGPADLPRAQAGLPYGVALNASGAGGLGPYTFLLTAGTLPPGISLASGGTLSGTSNTIGPANITVRATDASSAEVGGPFAVERALTVTVDPQATTTNIGAITPAAPDVNATYVVPVSVSATSGVPTGSVSVDDGTGRSCVATLSSGSGSCNLSSTLAGQRTITANYVGAGIYAASQGTTTLTVLSSAQVGSTVSAADRIGQRDRLVTVPISIRGDGTTVKFSARVAFDPAQFQSLELRPVAPATCTQVAPNQIEVSTLGSSRTLPLPQIDTPFCDMTARLVTTPQSSIDLSIDPATTSCQDGGGNTNTCQTRDGRILVSSLVTQPDDGTLINIAGYQGQASETRVLIFSNVGTAPVSVSNCQVSGQGFSLITPPPSPIPAGGNSRVLVGCTLSPFPETRQGGLLQCTSSDVVRTSLSFGLSCTTVAEGGQLPEDQIFNNSLKQGDEFGRSAAVSDTGGSPATPARDAKGAVIGNTQLMVIGAPNAGSDSAGRVFIFEGDLTPKALRRKDKGATRAGLASRLELDSMRLSHVLGPPRGANAKIGIGDKFGSSVAISPTGTRLAVGAPLAGSGDRGQVLIYDRPAGGWGELDVDDVVATIEAPAPDGLVSAQEFGNKLAFTPNGDLVVGAPGTDSISSQNIGAIFFFEVQGNGFTSTPQRTGSPNAVPNGRFGDALAANDATIVIGAPQEGSGNSQSGAAYMLPLANGLPTSPERFLASTTGIGDKFGSAVAIGPNGMVVVGAANDDAAGTNSGSATVFRPPLAGTAPIEVTTLVPDAGAEQGAGAAVATNGDLIVVGAPLAALDGNVRQGRAYLFEVEPSFATGSNIAPRPRLDVLRNADAEVGAEFGHAVAINRSIAVAGVPLDDRLIDNVNAADVGRVDPFALERIFRSDFE